MNLYPCMLILIAVENLVGLVLHAQSSDGWQSLQCDGEMRVQWTPCCAYVRKHKSSVNVLNNDIWKTGFYEYKAYTGL